MQYIYSVLKKGKKDDDFEETYRSNFILSTALAVFAP